MRSTALIITAGLVLMSSGVSAEETGTEDSTRWKKSLTIDFTTTQTTYSDSWVGGEAGSVNWVTNLNGHARKQLAPWLAYSTILKMSFGQTYNQDADTKRWRKPQKSTDLIDWEHVGRLTLHQFIDPYAAFRLETQFFDASVPGLQRYFSPLKLTESAGLARKFYEQDKDYITSRLGLGLRQTIKQVVIGDTALLQTVDSTLVDGGIESVTDVILTLNDQLRYVGKLSLYKALFSSESDAATNDDWQAVDVNWENQFIATIGGFITVNLYTQLLFDKQISGRLRLKETLAIGFLLKVF